MYLGAAPATPLQMLHGLGSFAAGEDVEGQFGACPSQVIVVVVKLPPHGLVPEPR